MRAVRTPPLRAASLSRCTHRQPQGHPAPEASRLLEPTGHPLPGLGMRNLLPRVRLGDTELYLVKKVELLDGVLNSGVVRQFPKHFQRAFLCRHGVSPHAYSTAA